MRGVRQGRIATWSRATSAEYAPRGISEAVNWRNLGDVRMPFKKLLLAAALATAAVATQAHADALASVMKSKVIKIAVPQDFAPFGSAGLDLKPQGYDIDMANLIGKELGVKTEIIPVASANRIPYLQTNKADLVISSLGKNEEREKVIDIITKAKASGDIAKLSEKWLKAPLPPGF